MFSAFDIFHKSSEKPLSEKGLSNVLHYANNSSRDIINFADNNRVSANNLMSYGSLLGDDLNDVTSKLGGMMLQWSNIMMEFSDAIDQYRDTLKSISIKEAVLQPGRDQKRKVKEKIEVLENSYSSMEKVQQLQEQLERLEQATEAEEVEMSNFKRIATREALYILLNGMHAMASKSDIISTFGKYIVDELDVDPIQVGQERPKYHAVEKTKRITLDAKKAIEKWNPDSTKVRRTLTSHHGHNPLIIKQLPLTPKAAATTSDIKSSGSGSVTPSPTNSSNSVKKKIILPPRFASLEEQNKQFSFYKPDDTVIGEAEDQPIKSPPQIISPSTSTSTTTVTNNLTNMYLHHPAQPGLNQKNLYQFYQHYLPPRSYEEMTSTFSTGAVFAMTNNNNNNNKIDAGGFVLPSTNPNFKSDAISNHNAEA